jgi:phage protein U
MKVDEGSYREHKRDTAASRARPVQFGGITEPELLVSGSILPAQDGGTMEENIDTLARGELGRNSGTAM